MFGDLESKIENFYDLDESSEDTLLAEIRKRAYENKIDFERFMEELGFGFETKRPIFYEAIWKSPVDFEDWLYEEQVKLVTAAENGDEDAIFELSSLMFLCRIETENKDFFQKSTAFILSKFNSKSPDVREHCSDALLDLVEMQERNLNSNEIQAFNKLLVDPNFNIRIYTYCNLKELKLLPSGFELSFWDRLRAKLTGRSGFIE